jgi:hypothetical protein
VPRAQQPQRIAVAVERAVRAPGDVGADVREQPREAGTVEHLHVVALEAGLGEQPLDGGHPHVEFALREAGMDAARLGERDVDAGFLGEPRRKLRPASCRQLRPASVRSKAGALALDPDQPEIAARGAMRDVAFVEDDQARTEVAQTPGDRRAGQPAADHRDVELVRASHYVNALARRHAPCRRTAVRVPPVDRAPA